MERRRREVRGGERVWRQKVRQVGRRILEREVGVPSGFLSSECFGLLYIIGYVDLFRCFLLVDPPLIDEDDNNNDGDDDFIDELP